ncbi:MAG: metalloregulator ArsR/SmtB family transcription factor [Microbacterium sp.]|uniref:metalloregulator ArsR/SmtB family transcription factor n=1 Tax=Microbacterium sp. TaxID=51671 RepID=UPI001AD4535A|nr:metalloregulator ArsR/SmtB family transcription factor [Microbacterium sp.]MBN9176383.1 metalloregulator ArsR/SmtB family transcription factor [Microbacterium sp.]
MDAVVSDATRTASVLADPTRMALLRLMSTADTGRVLVGETSRILGLRQPTVSHHMRRLMDEGIVTRQPEGRRTWYAIAPPHRDRVTALLSLADQRPSAPPDLDRVVGDLLVRFHGTLTREKVRRVVSDAHTRLSESTPHHLLASRTATFAIERIEASLKNRLHRDPDVTVLFVCVQNAGRSQIAASVLRRLAGPHIRVHTAGSAPADDVRSSIITVLDEVGLSLDGEFPKPLTTEVLEAADIVVTMGCGDICVPRIGATHLDWDIPDPAGLSLTELRTIRNDIDLRVRDLLPRLKKGESLAVHSAL